MELGIERQDKRVKYQVQYFTSELHCDLMIEKQGKLCMDSKRSQNSIYFLFSNSHQKKKSYHRKYFALVKTSYMFVIKAEITQKTFVPASRGGAQTQIYFKIKFHSLLKRHKYSKI